MGAVRLKKPFLRVFVVLSCILPIAFLKMSHKITRT